ncbi:von Willebrand factor type A domain-containing protein [Cognatiyoonia sediminum]|uniref:von Willebrand factor type A domain-containing protein n=1 Tax=Cognatiyoonia sediminum TaxID=1508389 RepID=A0A1M5RUZ4_9RHOB|nr:VWA domain-containing protein [Cognatiyoonia sediminum]SHH29858.1 von Willebrand factor type A domain-containing protein [Cognatiyoonia sediminum]
MALHKVNTLLGVCFVYFLVCSPKAYADASTVVILDASVSMATELDGGTRLSAAKQAVMNVLNETVQSEPSQPFGFISFYDGCWVDVMVKPRPLESVLDDIRGRVSNLQTREFGHTPIAKSLEIAGKLLEQDGGKIILVSDGQESCQEHRDLCELAEHLDQINIDFEIHLVGFALSPDQEDALRCIPQATGGTFVSVNRADDLISAVGFVATEAGSDVQDRCYDNRGGLLHWWCEK